MALSAMVYGNYRNGIPYLRWGTGARTLLFCAGGPGNLVPRGVGASGFTRGMRAFVDEYTIHLVTRKCGLPEGTTTRSLAADYAELIREDFGGHVDLVMGVSYGGLIAQHFAADYPELFSHLAIVMAAHTISDAAKQLDMRYAELIAEGRDGEAMALRAAAILPPGVRRRLMAAMLRLTGKGLLGKVDDTFRRDVVIEAKAEVAHEATASLGRIAAPVLIVGADDDFAFPLGAVEEMARLIRGATLKIYSGGHTAAFLDKRFAPDVRAFVAADGAAPLTDGTDTR